MLLFFFSISSQTFIFTGAVNGAIRNEDISHINYYNRHNMHTIEYHNIICYYMTYVTACEMACRLADMHKTEIYIF